MKRTRLSARMLPTYSGAEETMNMVTHIVGGGIAYTLGAILYGIGSRCKWFHSIFHISVVLGSLLQLICIYFYVF